MVAGHGVTIPVTDTNMSLQVKPEPSTLTWSAVGWLRPVVTHQSAEQQPMVLGVQLEGHSGRQHVE